MTSVCTHCQDVPWVQHCSRREPLGQRCPRAFLVLSSLSLSWSECTARSACKNPAVPLGGDLLCTYMAARKRFIDEASTEK